MGLSNQKRISCVMRSDGFKKSARSRACWRPKKTSELVACIAVHCANSQKSFSDMEYRYTTRFLRSFKKLEFEVKEDVIVATERFESGERESVGLHKLHGKFTTMHAFSANFSYRIVVKMKKACVYYVDVGTHDAYR